MPKTNTKNHVFSYLFFFSFASISQRATSNHSYTNKYEIRNVVLYHFFFLKKRFAIWRKNINSYVFCCQIDECWNWNSDKKQYSSGQWFFLECIAQNTKWIIHLHTSETNSVFIRHEIDSWSCGLQILLSLTRESITDNDGRKLDLLI